jgi:hypothetical protein
MKELLQPPLRRAHGGIEAELHGLGSTRPWVPTAACVVDSDLAEEG